MDLVFQLLPFAVVGFAALIWFTALADDWGRTSRGSRLWRRVGALVRQPTGTAVVYFACVLISFTAWAFAGDLLQPRVPEALALPLLGFVALGAAATGALARCGQHSPLLVCVFLAVTDGAMVFLVIVLTRGGDTRMLHLLLFAAMIYGFFLWLVPRGKRASA